MKRIERTNTHKASRGPQYVPDAAAIPQALVERGYDAHDERVAAALAQFTADRHKARRTATLFRILQVLGGAVDRAAVRFVTGVVII